MTSPEITLIDPVTDREHIFKCHYHLEDEEIILDEVRLVVYKPKQPHQMRPGQYFCKNGYRYTRIESENILDIVERLSRDVWFETYWPGYPAPIFEYRKGEWIDLDNQLCDKIYEDLIVQKKEVSL